MGHNTLCRNQRVMELVKIRSCRFCGGGEELTLTCYVAVTHAQDRFEINPLYYPTMKDSKGLASPLQVCNRGKDY